jgi:hypothetical protein
MLFIANGGTEPPMETTEEFTRRVRERMRTAIAARERRRS